MKIIKANEAYYDMVANCHISKGAEYEVSDERAKVLCTAENRMGRPLATIVTPVKKKK